MKNNRRVKMIAWIMTAVMLLCTMPVAAMATGATGTFSLSTIKTGDFILNESADCDVFYTKGSQVLEDLSLAIANQDYTMEFSVSEKDETPLPGASLYYELPDEVYSIDEGSNSDVSWKKDGKYLVFNWTGEPKPGFEAKVTARIAKMYDLYNIASINGTWCRLAKTKIWTHRVLSNNLGRHFYDLTEFGMEEYNFVDQVIIFNGKEYVYDCEKNQEMIAATGRSYTYKFSEINPVKNKIGAMNGNTPRWAVPEEQRYGDKNETDSFHANYEIYLKEVPIDQDLYNMLKVRVNNTDYYYRLKKGTINAIDAVTATYGYGNKVDASKYTLYDEYDFSNVVLHIDGIDYVYSDHQLKGEYHSHFTVKFERVTLQNRVNGDDAWYRNPMGFLDGSQVEYKNIPNQTISYHRDYLATLHKGTLPDYGVKISSSLAGKTRVPEGTMVTLTGTPIGFENTPYSIRWERMDPETGEVTVIEGQNSLTYTFPITEETSKYDYYIVLTPLE